MHHYDGKILEATSYLHFQQNGVLVEEGVLDENQLAAFRNQHIGFVFQDHHLLPQLTVIENVLVPALAGGNPTTDQLGRAAELLESVPCLSTLEARDPWVCKKQDRD